MATAELFVLVMNAQARRDTNRYARGWQLAGNAAARSIGAGPFTAVLPVKAASRHAQYIRRMGKERASYLGQIKRLRATLQAWYGIDVEGSAYDLPGGVPGGTFRKGGARRPDRFSRELEGKIRKRMKWVARLDEEIAKARGSESVLFFYRTGDRNFSTVRVPVYGGEGRVFRRSGRFEVELHNKEAHCQVLEARYGYVRVAGNVARNGLAKVGRAYGAALAAAPVHAKVRVA